MKPLTEYIKPALGTLAFVVLVGGYDQVPSRVVRAIDDDHGRPGHSLVSRGLYPDRVSRSEMLEVRAKNFNASGARLRMAHFSRIREAVNRIHSVIRRIPALKFGLFL